MELADQALVGELGVHLVMAIQLRRGVSGEGEQEAGGEDEKSHGA